MIEIARAPGFLTVQDLGWPVGRSWGLPRGGAMDPGALARANLLAGNPAGAAALEWALGTGTVRFHHGTTFALTGAGGEALLDRRPVRPFMTLSAGPATVLELRPGAEERFLYLAFRGGLDIPELLGSRSTYLPAELGGLSGRRLHAGDRIGLLTAAGRPPSDGSHAPAERRDPDAPMRVTRGPQWDGFTDEARRTFLGGEYTVATASDRMGYRLEGPAVPPRAEASLPSEAACPGAIQVPDGGQPIVLMPDGPTVGGYAKLAVVIAADLPRLAQCAPGRVVRFREVTAAEARGAFAAERAALAALEAQLAA